MTRTMTQPIAYPVDLTRDEDGCTIVAFPDLPEALTGHADRDAALALAADCLEVALAGRMEDGEAIPPPSPARGRPRVAPSVLIAAKAALYVALRESGMTKVGLAARLGCNESDARRLLDPGHPSKIGRLEAALAVFGRRLEVRVRDAA